MDESRKLHILWTNTDVNTAQLMVLFYATNAMVRDLWDEVTVIIWGSTAKLAAEDEKIQQQIKIAQHAGVKFSACVSCATQLGVVDELKSMNVELIAWAQPLTDILQSDGKLLSV